MIARRLGLPAAAFLLGFALSGIVSAHPAANLTDGCIETFNPAVDYFPQKTTIDYAGNFAVDYFNSYKVVTVMTPFRGGAPERYVLVQCGAPVPELAGDLAVAQLVTVPLASIFSASATHNPMIDALGLVDRLTGVASLAFTANEAILAAGAAGRIVEFAPTFETNVELVISTRPGALMTAGSDDPAYRVLRAAGIPIVANAEWLETNVLARAEWIKYIALFFNAEGRAETVFADVDHAYAEAALAVAGIPNPERPLILSGSSFQGIFYASGGQSYVAQIIAAAGGRYAFADNTDVGGTAHADLELILDRAAGADIWINAATTYRTLADIMAEEPRLAALPAAQNGQVWVYDRLATPTGAIGYWELGVLRPDLILKDLIKIFHPERMADHAFVFYRPIAIGR